MKSLFYHTAKDSLTKLTKEEISVDADQLKAKTADETDHTQKVQAGIADGNIYEIFYFNYLGKIDSLTLVSVSYLFFVERELDSVVCLNKHLKKIFFYFESA